MLWWNESSGIKQKMGKSERNQHIGSCSPSELHTVNPMVWSVCQHKRLVATRYTSALSRCVEGEWTSVGRKSTAREREPTRGSALKGRQAWEESAAESCKITDKFTSSVNGSWKKKTIEIGGPRSALHITLPESILVMKNRGWICMENYLQNKDSYDLSCRVEASWW